MMLLLGKMWETRQLCYWKDSFAKAQRRCDMQKADKANQSYLELVASTADLDLVW
jgi:hypothetical protein